MNYRVLIDNSLTGIYVHQAGKFLFLNEAFAKMLGCTKDELIGEDYQQLIHPDDRREVSKRAARILNGQNKSSVSENRMLRKDGTALWCQAFEKAITYQGKPAILGNIIDITHHKQREDELIDETTRRRILVEQSRDGIVVLDINGKAYEANQRFAEMIGYTPEEVLNLYVWDWETKFPAEKVKEMLQTVDEAGDHFETVHRRKDGTTYDVEISTNGAVIAGQKLIFCVCRDITQRKKSEEEMKMLNQQLEQRQLQSNALSEMRNLLESCTTMHEIPDIIKSTVSKLFPETDGALFLLSNSRTDLELYASWGDFIENIDGNAFAPDECWGLRRGQIYTVEDTKIGPVCTHLKHSTPKAYMCLPLIAKSDVQGLLYIRIHRSTEEQKAQKKMAELKEAAVILGEYVSLTIADIKLRDSLKNLSIRDHLTGLFNRRYMEEMVQREILRAKRNDTQVAIIMADIDYFKRFNDSNGHEAGDLMLAQLANYFKSNMRGSDIVSRYGGEEFVFCLSETSLKNAYERANTMISDIRKMSFEYRGRYLPSVTISMGIAVYPDHASNVEDLLRIADAALYRAKREGRDRAVTADKL